MPRVSMGSLNSNREKCYLIKVSNEVVASSVSNLQKVRCLLCLPWSQGIRHVRGVRGIREIREFQLNNTVYILIQLQKSLGKEFFVLQAYTFGKEC